MGGLPCPFFKTEKKGPMLEKKVMVVFICFFLFFIENVVLGVSKETTPKFLPAGPFFVCF